MAEESEEAFREAACIGDVDEVSRILELGVDVNTANKVNGWTALHWASKRGHTQVVTKLIEAGAKKDIENTKGEIPADLTKNNKIREILEAPLLNDEEEATQNKPSFIPNYLANPEFPYVKPKHKDRSNNERMNNFATSEAVEDGSGFIFKPKEVICTTGNQWAPTGLVIDPDMMVICVRLAGFSRYNSDFVELEMNRHEAPTLEVLTELCCECLDVGIKSEHVKKIRKLPHTFLKNDKDVRRLTDYQTLELVLQPNVLHPFEGALSSPEMGTGEHAETKYMKNQVAKLIF